MSGNLVRNEKVFVHINYRYYRIMTRGRMRGKKSSKTALFYHVNMYLNVEKFYSRDDIATFRLSGAVFEDVTSRVSASL